ncbi:hypothetical protein VCHC17A1_1064A, partial [Vibrio cholerae HC-17A1]
MKISSLKKGSNFS